MNTGKYIMRSLRYTLRMAVILAVVFALLALTGLLEVPGGNFFHALFRSRNGLLLLGALVILAGIYPRISFAEVSVPGDIHSDRHKIKDTFEAYGYVIDKEEEKMISFRAAKLTRRLASQWDDGVTVRGLDGKLELEGMKKDIYRLEARLRAALRTDE